MIWVDAVVQQRGWALLARHPEVELSLTNATSAAAARALAVKTVFGFDGDFRALGFNLVPSR